MGTRGCYGFRKNGADKLTYNHYDSYPDWLGTNMVKFCKETSVEEMHEIFDRLILVDRSSAPTKEQIVECIKFYDGSVSARKPEDWYCLLREAQGEPSVYKNGLRYMIDDNDFIEDSLFCEYAYIINLDTNCLEFWKGFQKDIDVNNRYGTKVQHGKYYPCKMMAEYPLENMSECSVEDVVADMEKNCGYEEE